MQGKIFYNKLIRDKIPENICSAGYDCETRELPESEFEVELIKKVVEEATEVAEARSRDEMVKEIADLEDVLVELKTLKEINEEELAVAKKKAMDRKGGFLKRLFLVWSSDDGYKTNEKKGVQ